MKLLRILPTLGLVYLSCTQARELECDRHSPNTQDVLMCLQIDLQKSDRQLNRSYQKLYQSLIAESSDPTPESKDAARKLKLAQKQWLAFIESDCEGKYQLARAGTARNVIQASCLLEHQKLRTRQLTDWNK